MATNSLTLLPRGSGVWFSSLWMWPDLCDHLVTSRVWWEWCCVVFIRKDCAASALFITILKPPCWRDYLGPHLTIPDEHSLPAILPRHQTRVQSSLAWTHSPAETTEWPCQCHAEPKDHWVMPYPNSWLTKSCCIIKQTIKAAKFGVICSWAIGDWDLWLMTLLSWWNLGGWKGGEGERYRGG